MSPLSLGKGSFSTVYLAESRAEKSSWVAIKVVEKNTLLQTKNIPNPAHLAGNTTDDEELDDCDEEYDILSMSMMEQNEKEIMRLVDKEIRIMSELDHPHVIHLEEVYEDENRVCFVMELAQGGEVFDRLVEKVTISLLYCLFHMDMTFMAIFSWPGAFCRKVYPKEQSDQITVVNIGNFWLITKSSFDTCKFYEPKIVNTYFQMWICSP